MRPRAAGGLVHRPDSHVVLKRAASHVCLQTSPKTSFPRSRIKNTESRVTSPQRKEVEPGRKFYIESCLSLNLELSVLQQNGELRFLTFVAAELVMLA